MIGKFWEEIKYWLRFFGFIGFVFLFAFYLSVCTTGYICLTFHFCSFDLLWVLFVIFVIPSMYICLWAYEDEKKND